MPILDAVPMLRARRASDGRRPGAAAGAVARRLGGHAAELAVALAAGAVTTFAVHGVLVAIHARATDAVTPGLGPVWAAAMLALAVAGVLVQRRGWPAARTRFAVATLAGAAAGLAMAPMIAGLLGTQQPPFTILGGDMAFRTEAVTRFASTWHLDDYTFHGLGAFYPPAWFWAAGRAAAWLGVTPWQMVKPMTIATVGVALLASFALWRMALRPGWALAAAVGSSLVLPTQVGPIDHATEAWYSAYSCFVAIVGVAWLAAAWSTVRAPAGRGRLVALAAVGAVLALTYDLLFVLVAVVLLALAASAGAGRRPLARAAALCAAIAALTAPFWISLLRAVAGGSAAQGHFVRPDFLRVTTGLGGPTALAVLVVLAVAALAASWSAPASRAVAALLAGTIAYQLLSVATLALAHQQLQPHRAVAMLWATAGAAIPVALAGLTAPGGRLRAVAARPALAATAIVALVATFALGAAQGTGQASGPFARAAHDRVDLGPTDAIAGLIAATAHRPPDRLTVLTDDRALLVTRPYFGFLPLRARYAHPQARLGERIALLRAVAACPDPACATRLLTRSPFGPVDALALPRTPRGLEVRTERDGFPDPLPVTIDLPARLLDPAVWAHGRAGGLEVYVRRAPA